MVKNKHKCNKHNALTILSLLVVAISVSACGTSVGKRLSKLVGLEEKIVITGKREAVIQTEDDPNVTNRGSVKKIANIPRAIKNKNWTQPGGVPSNAPHNLVLPPNVKEIWRGIAGTGTDSYGRVMASPIVVDGIIYTLDSRATIAAFNAETGQKIWQKSLLDPNLDPEGMFGGGLASDGKKIFAAIASGHVIALNQKTGSEIWRTNIGNLIRTSPTVSTGKLFVVPTSNEVHAINTKNGNIEWTFQGIEEKTSLINNASPAIQDGIVVAPSTSGEVVAIKQSNGEPIWSDILSTVTTQGRAINLNTIAAKPVIDRGQVFAIAHSGYMIAFDLTTGERLWTKTLSSSQTPWVVGNYVFIISERQTIIALNRNSGDILWEKELPISFFWNGPVFAGDRLILVNSEGRVVSISIKTGEVSEEYNIGDTVYVSPIIANGTAYIITDSAEIIALR